MYVVKFRGRFEDSMAEWKPTEGDDYEVTEDVARDRFRVLLSAGLSGTSVDGVVPALVRIELSPLVSPQVPPEQRCMLSQCVGRGEVAVGPWAALALAS